MYQKTLLKQKEQVLQAHESYPQFAKFMKRTSRKQIRDTSIVSYLKQLESMRSKYGLDLERPDIVVVIDSLIAAGLTAQVVNVRRTVLRKYMKFLKQKLTDDELEALKNQGGPPRNPLRKRDIVTEEMLEQILSLTSDPAIRAYYAVLWDLGLRPSEGSNLDVSQVVQDENGFRFLIDTDQSKVKNVWGLRNLYLIEPISIMHFQAWWAMHPRRNDPKAPLFIAIRGKRINPHYAGSNLRAIRDKLGLEVLSLYLLRKSMATRWIAMGRDERLLRYRMGHTKNSKMIEMHYLAMADEDFEFAELALLGVQKKKKEVMQSSVKCPKCGQMNRIEEHSCFRCGTALTENERVRRSQVSLQSLLSDEETLAQLISLVSDRLSS